MSSATSAKSNSDELGKAAKLPSQTQRATAALRDMIVNNQLPPGASYLESELAEMLGQELELPRIQPKGKDTIVSKTIDRFSFGRI